MNRIILLLIVIMSISSFAARAAVLIAEDFETSAAMKFVNPGEFGTAIRLTSTNARESSGALELYEAVSTPFGYADGIYPADAESPVWEAAPKTDYELTFWIRNADKQGWRSFIHLTPNDHANHTVGHDYYEARLAPDSGTGGGSIALFVRFQGVDYFLNDDSANGVWTFDNSFDWDAWHQVRFAYHAGAVSLYVDDMTTPRISQTDAARDIPAGTFSIVTTYPPALGGNTIQIDDVAVTGEPYRPPMQTVISDDFEGVDPLQKWIDPGEFGTAIRLTSTAQSGSQALELYEATATPFAYADGIYPVDAAWPDWNASPKTSYALSFWMRNEQRQPWRAFIHLTPNDHLNHTVGHDYYELRMYTSGPDAGGFTQFVRFQGADYYLADDAGASSWLFDAAFDLSVWHQYKFEYADGRVSFYVDDMDTPKVTQTDPQRNVAAGTFSLVSTYPPAPGGNTIQIDNVLVEQPLSETVNAAAHWHLHE